jgi:hypothetical protein
LLFNLLVMNIVAAIDVKSAFFVMNINNIKLINVLNKINLRSSSDQLVLVVKFDTTLKLTIK